MTEQKQRPPSKRYQAIYCRVAVEGRAIEAVASEFAIAIETVERVVRHVKHWFQLGCPGLLEVDRAVIGGVALRDLHLARLEHQWDEVMAAWYRSKQPEEVEKATVDEKKQVKGEKTRRSQSGDVKYLNLAREILAEIRLLRGVTRESLAKEDDDVATLTLDERATRFTRIMQDLRDRAGAAANLATDPGSLVAADTPGALRAA
jgi:hypothetical protein